MSNELNTFKGSRLFVFSFPLPLTDRSAIHNGNNILSYNHDSRLYTQQTAIQTRGRDIRITFYFHEIRFLFVSLYNNFI